MKKNLTFLKGIVFLSAILVAVGCSTSPKKDTNGDPGAKAPAVNSNNDLLDSLRLASKKIYIICKAEVAEDGSLQFTMADKDDIVVAKLISIDPLNFVANDTTEVKAKNMVVWQWAKSSIVQEFKTISPEKNDGDIMRGDAEPLEKDSRKKLKYDIPDDAKEGLEKYFIQFTWDDKTVTIDPYLKLPKQQ